MSTSQNEKDMETFFPEGKKLTICKEEFVIRPFVLKNRIKVVRIVAEIMGEMAINAKDVQANPNIAMASLIQTAGERLIDIYEIVLGKDREWLMENLQMKDELEILKAMMEVNDLPFLLSQVQELAKLGVRKS